VYSRRNLIKFLLLLGPSSLAMGLKSYFQKGSQSMDKKVVLKEMPLDFMWPTQEPFLFCVHHYDQYPAGNNNNGLDAHHFKGRNMGSDFQPKDGFRLYHGEEVPVRILYWMWMPFLKRLSS
jgi:hypothetical protein